MANALAYIWTTTSLERQLLVYVTTNGYHLPLIQPSAIGQEFVPTNMLAAGFTNTNLDHHWHQQRGECKHHSYASVHCS